MGISQPALKEQNMLYVWYNKEEQQLYLGSEKPDYPEYKEYPEYTPMDGLRFYAENGVVKEKTEKELEADRFSELAKDVRERRNELLQDCDYVMLPDYPLADKSGWIEYRQALRDVPEQKGFPDSVIWPSKPL
jgi:hypothetical protein